MSQLIYPISWAGGTEQYTYLYNAWAACQFTNNTGAPINVIAVTVWCRGGTSGTYAFVNTTNSTSGAVTSAASAPPADYDMKTYPISSGLTIAPGATFYAGVRGTSTTAPVDIMGYQNSTGNAWYNGSTAGGTLDFYPTMGGAAKRVLGIKVVYESGGVIYIDNGSAFEAYEIYIDNGTTWEKYVPCIDNGSGWDQCT